MSKYGDADFIAREALALKDRRSECNVWIANLPLNTTERDLYVIAKDYGLVVSSKLMPNHCEQYGSFTGLVDYSSNVEAARAVSLLNGKKLTPDCKGVLTVSFAHNDGPCNFPEKSKIILFNLPSNVYTDDIMQVFKIYGNVLAIKPPARGTASVQYSSPESAATAVRSTDGSTPFRASEDGRKNGPVRVMLVENERAVRENLARQALMEDRQSVTASVTASVGSVATSRQVSSTVSNSQSRRNTAVRMMPSNALPYDNNQIFRIAFNLRARQILSIIFRKIGENEVWNLRQGTVVNEVLPRDQGEPYGTSPHGYTYIEWDDNKGYTEPFPLDGGEFAEVTTASVSRASAVVKTRNVKVEYQQVDARDPKEKKAKKRLKEEEGAPFKTKYED